MKTNIKKGLFIYGFIPVDTAHIKLADTHTDAGLTFHTKADGGYAVLAGTDEEGIVTELTIDLENSPYNFMKDSFNEQTISSDDVLVKDGEIIPPAEDD
ncbi:hypothetical protein J0K78_04975 [Halobacillus sp. GSS1]|uniref:hypothetical protein n=1 Tax=Halobacillus sp. GSS1 TaxID=2815919 RepID=UPI001A8D428F|nr:hypothetical protein [Halobacillus sp. GSS1]MBN9653613.1 hypothetical protein [Halobacillus sp. GSS1]